MRDRKVQDAWRGINKLENYPLRLKRVTINNSLKLCTDFQLELNAGITAVCGKNGVGKSTILRDIFNTIVQDDSELVIDIYAEKLQKKSQIVEAVNKPELKNKINYIEPSIECAKILEYLKTTTNIDELLDGVDPNGIFKNEKNRNDISQIIGKHYKNIELYEIEGALGSDHTFPFIQVELNDGTRYSCLDMGMGEFLCIYICWYFNWIEQGSIVLIEEIENFISAYSQITLINYLALQSQKRGLWTLLTSHSEHILSCIGTNNIRIVYKNVKQESQIVTPKHASKYLESLGIKFNKKGAILVEDGFASFFCSYLINKFSHELLKELDVIFLSDGESNVEKIAKHFKPKKPASYELVAVFDADMSAKVLGANQGAVRVAALPSKSKHNPETELWHVASSQVTEIASKLDIDDESRVLEAINNFGSLDYHDRFTKIAENLHKSWETYLNAIASVWLNVRENYLLAIQFILSLKYRGQIVDKGMIGDFYKSKTGDNLDDLYPSLRKSETQNFYVVFDGTKLNFIESK
ncbi:ATP-dependent nuclease [Thalassomonas haliotis]|uniref:Rad50/SbcC-type AAA domain-containing protein n=1 Tax=Thalassomonas haliotis TaxID=485448 RepID=A0ABY7VID1_9GAMM|nr:ABC transporter ATP-binding protein [Thalassomonas haliotis]WDE13490.1 hypothetical protein H3N35_08665 [Thalassomonas haliotis]